MELDFLQEAFKKLNVLNENAFDTSEKGIDDLRTFKDIEDDTDSVDVIDTDATDSTELKDSYVNKVILQCPICHSFVFENRNNIEIDLNSHLANASKECPYCCEVGGYEIIGQVTSYDDSANADSEDIEPKDEVDVTDEVEVDSDVEDISDTDVNECMTAKVEDECYDSSDLAEKKVVVQNSFDTFLSDLINDSFGIDNWTTFEYDDEDVDTDADESKFVFNGKVVIYNGEDVLGEFEVVDGNLVKVDTDSDNDTDVEVTDECMHEDMSITTNDDSGNVVVSDGNTDITISTRGDSVEPAEPAVDTVEDSEDENQESEDEIIEPLTDEEKEDIANGESDEDEDDNKSEALIREEVEEDVTDFDEKYFDRLGEKYLTKTYENVDSYKTTNATSEGNTLRLEGIINFKSGKSKPTSFVLEAKDITRSGDVRFVGTNKTFTEDLDAFTVTGKLRKGKFLPESLDYKYRVVNDGKSMTVSGKVSNK